MQLHIEKLVFGGQGLARTPEGKVALVWNALPGEDVEIEILKNQKGYLEAMAKKIITVSPDRIPPRESHWLSSSPWQMMTSEAESLWKRTIAAETYSKFGGLILQSKDLELVTDDANAYGYRNKIEFSFTVLEDGTISLAFFERGKKIKQPAQGSLLAKPSINETATHILAWINDQHIPIRSLKSLIIRSSSSPKKESVDGESEEKTIAALFIKDRLEFPSLPTLTDTCIGFHLYYSTHLSPASVPTALLKSIGPDYLTATLHETTLKYGLLSFFQVNVPIFLRTLDDIASFLHPKIPVIDFYCGVGAISLPLSLNRESCTLVDNNDEAIRYARENILANDRKNCEAHCLPAEKMLEAINETSMVILDPPRAGLHPDVVTRLLRTRPLRLMYLSCDLATQARDLLLLSEGYKISFQRLYNFFPRTPHIEGLCVLDRLG